MIAVDPEDWMRAGECVGADPEVFFPTQGESVSEAKAICAPCPIRVRCLEYALDNNIVHGIWGGASERERRRMRRARRAALVNDETAGVGDTHARVLELLAVGPHTAEQLAERLGVSRNWINKTTRDLYNTQRVTRTGWHPYTYHATEQP